MAGPPAAVQAATSPLGRTENTWGAPAAFWPAGSALRGGDQPPAQAVGTRPKTAAACPQRTGGRPPALTGARRPNEVWTLGFKGWFRPGDGTKLEPLTVRDLCRRYLPGIDRLPRQNMAGTRLVLEGLFQAYGLPQVIRADNGSPFGATGALGLTRLSAWWARLGIRVEFIEPGQPEQNGAHEQMHRVCKAQTLNPPARTLSSPQRRTKQGCREYNFERPHEALGMAVPADHYRKRRGKMPGRIAPWKHPKGGESRLVKGNGLISRKGRSRFVGEAFERQRVGLKRLSQGNWQVCFGPLLAGELSDEEHGGIRAVVYRKKKRP